MRGPADLEASVCRARHVDGLGAVEMPALDEYDARAERQDPLAGRAHVVERADRHLGQHLRLRHVRRDDVRARQQLGPDRGDGLGLEQPVAALGDHHRIDDDVRQVELGDCRGHGLDDGGVGEHADLDGVGADVAGHRLDLRRDQVGLAPPATSSRRACSGP